METTRGLATVAIRAEDAEDLPDRVKVEIDEDSLYTAEEVGIFIGVKTGAEDPQVRKRVRRNAVYKIPEDELPFRWTAGRKRYLGRDVIRYRNGGQG